MKKTTKKLPAEKKFILKGKTFFQFKNFFEAKDAPDFLIIISIRGSGKTTASLKLALENFFKYGKRFVWCRRRKIEIDQIKNDISGFNKFKWKGKTEYIYRQGDKLFVEINGKKALCGWLISISTFYNIKGRDFNDASLLVFDEFISEKNDYLTNEFSVFTNILTTVQRNRKPFKTILLGNNINPFNEYLLQLGFWITKDQEIYEKVNDKGFKIMLVNDKNLQALHKEYEDTAAYQLAQFNNQLKAYLIDGEFRYQNSWICPYYAYEKASPQYNFYLNGLAFHTRSQNTITYFVDGTDRNCIQTFGLTQYDCHEHRLPLLNYDKLAEIWSRKMYQNMAAFSSVKLYENIIKWFKYYKPQNVL